MSTSQAVVVGDIGGTNARLQLFWYSHQINSSIVSIQHVMRQTYRTSIFVGLTPILQRFFDDIRINDQAKIVHEALEKRNIRIVLAVCGPLWNNGRSNDPNNVRMEPDGARWPSQHADIIEKELNLPSYALAFLNDFEAIGYCLAGQVDSNASDLCKFTKMIILHPGSPDTSSQSNAPVACLGAGTGLGACFLTPDGTGRYQVYPSEAGMTDTFAPQNDEEWALLQYLRHREPFVEIEQIVSGPGFISMLNFYSEHLHQNLSPKLAEDLQQVSQDDAPGLVAQHARDHHDELCLRVVDTFLDIFGRTLGTAAQTFLPYRGLYITGGILPKLSWRWQENVDNRLLKSYLDQGTKMSSIVAQVPLILINDDDLGLKGCLYYMTTHVRQS